MAKEPDTSPGTSERGGDKHRWAACDFSPGKPCLGREVSLTIIIFYISRYTVLQNVRNKICSSNLFSSFNDTFHFQHIEEGPILTNAIVTLSPKTGEVLSSWGAGFFYMPHGITIDRQGNVWVTDVAMHQVFKVKKKHRFYKYIIL